jgi:hypothetical protein
MNDLLGHAQYVAGVALLIVVYALIGLCVLQIVVGKAINENLDYLLLSPGLGVATLCISSVILGKWGVPVSSGNLLLLFLGLVAAAASTCRRDRDIRISKWITGPPSAQFVRFLIIAVLIGLAPYYQLMNHPGFVAGFGTSATWTNNDLGAYLQMASNVVHSGFHNAGFIDGWNAGFQASFDHPAAQTLFAASSQLLFRDPFQMGIVVVSALLGSLFMTGIVLARRLSHRIPSFWTVVTSAAIVVNPAVFAMVANFFFAQLLAICLVMCAFALGVLCIHRSMTWQLMSLLSLVSFASFLTSPEIAIVLVPPILVVCVLQLQPDVWFKTISRLVGTHLLFGLVLRIVSGSLLFDQVAVLRRNTGGGVAGWKANLLSPTALLGFAPTQLSGPYSTGTRILDALVISIALIVIVRFAVIRKLNWKAFFFLSVFLFPILPAILKWGSDGYQTWKLLTTLVPFVGITLWSIGKLQDHNAFSPIQQYLSLLVIGATIAWVGFVWRETSSTSYINRDAAGVSLSVQMKRQTGVNILVAPYFETMALSVVSGRPTHISSPSYQFPNGQPIKYGCTLTTKDRVKDLTNAGEIVHERGVYVLIGTPKCD